MKIKLAYPKIPDVLACPLKQCIAFEKYDGTNIHWVMDHQDWYEYGTRRDRYNINTNGVKAFEEAHPELVRVHTYWDQKNELRDYLNNHPNYNSAKRIIVFTEYVGLHSFAGSHDPKDLTKQLIIFDIEVDGKLISPAQFIEDLKQFNIAKVVFQGKYSGQLFVDVRKNIFNLNEGVVIKGMVNNQLYMAKIKTNSYLEKLKNKFEDNWKDYWE